ncbi:MAG: head-tail adaptor protein [Muribaculaceae bacterium]|nr:head-tail adaptor protein [Muribaculaceae bacterium]
MKSRLTIIEPVVVVDDFHAEKTVWTKRKTIRAERVKESAYRRHEVSEMFPEHRTEFNIRDAHRVGENWRVEEVGGLEYTVTAILANRDRGMKTLICERLNK